MLSISFHLDRRGEVAAWVGGVVVGSPTFLFLSLPQSKLARGEGGRVDLVFRVILLISSYSVWSTHGLDLSVTHFFKV